MNSGTGSVNGIGFGRPGFAGAFGLGVLVGALVLGRGFVDVLGLADEVGLAVELGLAEEVGLAGFGVFVRLELGRDVWLPPAEPLSEPVPDPAVEVAVGSVEESLVVSELSVCSVSSADEVGELVSSVVGSVPSTLGFSGASPVGEADVVVTVGSPWRTVSVVCVVPEQPAISDIETSAESTSGAREAGNTRLMMAPISR